MNSTHISGTDSQTQNGVYPWELMGVNAAVQINSKRDL